MKLGLPSIAFTEHVATMRHWTTHSGQLDLASFEDDFRDALRATADSGRAPEISTVIPMKDTILRWWREKGWHASHSAAMPVTRWRQAKTSKTPQRWPRPRDSDLDAITWTSGGSR